MKKLKNPKRCIVICCAIGLPCILLGIAGFIQMPSIISTAVGKNMVLLPSNPSFAPWQDYQLPIYQKFYFFNVTNADQVEKEGALPKLVEVGPFVFRLKLSKKNLTFNEDKSKLKYREWKQYYFERKKSVSDLNVHITTLNAPVAVAFVMTDFDALNAIERVGTKNYLSTFKFFWTVTVGELLFEGKKNSFSCMDPEPNPECKFSYLRGPNGNDTNDGLFEIFTGYNDTKHTNTIISLNGANKLDFWAGDECNKIEGASPGAPFPPLAQNQQTLQFFRSQFCRVLPFTKIQASIPSNVNPELLLDRFVPEKNVFANASSNTANACYKPNPEKKSVEDNRGFMEKAYSHMKENGFGSVFEALFKAAAPAMKSESYRERPSGVFDISACLKGMPVLLSWPHFYGADPHYMNAVSGLRPSESKHRTYMDIHPMTGAPVELYARIQVNIDVRTELHENTKMKSLVFPAFWQELSNQLVDDFSARINAGRTWISVFAFFIFAVGVILLGVALFIYTTQLKPLAKQFASKKPTKKINKQFLKQQKRQKQQASGSKSSKSSSKSDAKSNDGSKSKSQSDTN